ncbi:hypothetical protein M432DRAFT_234497 [Thermoascus aurantiacus ATCC 26904]
MHSPPGRSFLGSWILVNPALLCEGIPGMRTQETCWTTWRGCYTDAQSGSCLINSRLTEFRPQRHCTCISSHISGI